MASASVRETIRAGFEHHSGGRLVEAERLYREALSAEPANGDALRLLGTLLHQSGRHEQAIEALQRSLQRNTRIANTHNTLGEALRASRRISEAIGSYRDALVLDPAYPEAHNNLGIALRESGEVDEAIEELQMAVSLRPQYASAHFNLGTILLLKGELDGAAKHLRVAAELRPNDPAVHAALGDALSRLSRETLAEAIGSYRRAIALDPNHADAHKNLGMALLLSGDFENGWEEMEWRWRSEVFTSPRWTFDQPVWDGSELDGKTILLHGEQGLGDSIQFVRYAPLVHQRGGRVIVQCPRELVSLFGRVEGVEQIVESTRPAPHFDFHCPLMGLPRLFHTTLASIPANVPYLSADPEIEERWRRRIVRTTPLQVGICWGGNPMQGNDRNRSCSLGDLLPLAGVPGITLHSLQKGPRAAQVYHPPEGMFVVDHSAELHDFEQTAALIANLDLVISVCTSVAHLAGAMGRPTWTMLCAVPDWRWMLDRADSPWYPTMKLFRQERAGDWRSVAQNLAAGLRELRDRR
jgi:Flp pilus assembly protein TadD